TMLVAGLFLLITGAIVKQLGFARNLKQGTTTESQKSSLVAPGPVSDFDVKRYDLNLKIDPAAKIISGSVTMQAIARAPELSTITLDLWDNMAVSSVSSEGHD